MGPVICKNRHFQVTIKTVICEVLHGHLHHLQGMRTLNANRHLARFVTFEAIIFEVLLYIVTFALGLMPPLIQTCQPPRNSLNHVFELQHRNF